ncbi:hypothetical protein, partial [Klebsiella pneumoniae]|uniref:hypothetical protein n=1 Tax=Klebsiella pneumoniae TaxID=573 RepID=UPI0024DED9B7
NISHLKDDDYIKLIKSTIEETQEEYQEDETVNPTLLWDMIKLKVREKSLKFSADKKRKTNNRETSLEKKIFILERELENPILEEIQKKDII